MAPRNSPFPALEALIDAGHEIPLVLTQPDRPAGRKQEIQTPPVKQLPPCATTSQSSNPRDQEQPRPSRPPRSHRPRRHHRRSLRPHHPPWMLDLPRYGNINSTARSSPNTAEPPPSSGPSPTAKPTPASPPCSSTPASTPATLLLAQPVPSPPTTPPSELFHIARQVGASLMLKTLSGLEHGTITPQPQDHSHATLAPILTREDGRIDFTPHRPPNSTIAGAASSPGPAPTPLFAARAHHPPHAPLHLGIQPSAPTSSTFPPALLVGCRPKHRSSSSTKSSWKANPACPAPNSPATSSFSTSEQIGE